jgi:hypothetical protein
MRGGNDDSRTVRRYLVVLTTPCLDHRAGVREIHEPMLGQAVIAQSSVERLDVRVLIGLPGLDEP